jgi:hypothetical protein
MPDVLPAQHPFSKAFEEAREKFRAAANTAGAVTTTYEHPQRALSGGVLSCDTAWLGDSSAENVLVTVSGTHGIEGYAGSALQVADLTSMGVDEQPSTTARLHIHGINPWGMDRLQRATENNVDLNRNFFDHASGLPDNADYRDLHDIVCPKDWNETSAAQIMGKLDEYAAEQGSPRLVNGLISGQYSHPQGLNFGGAQPEWSNLVLQQIVRDQLSQAKRVLFIDWHTGLGGFGEGVFLCFNDKHSDEFALACDFFGADRIAAEHFADSGTPRYQGLLCRSVLEDAPGAKVLTLVVEFGTRGRSRVRPALMLDRWLQVEGRPRGEQIQTWQSALRDVFDPQDEKWRAAVTTAGAEILAQAYSGLARWSV